MQAFSAIHRFEEAVGNSPALVASGDSFQAEVMVGLCYLGTCAAKSQDTDPDPTCETLQGTVLPPW